MPDLLLQGVAGIEGSMIAITLTALLLIASFALVAGLVPFSARIIAAPPSSPEAPASGRGASPARGGR